MNQIRSFDWQMISFVAISLVNEYLIHFHLPRVYYWNGEKEYHVKMKHRRNMNSKKNNKNEDSDFDDKAA